MFMKWTHDTREKKIFLSQAKQFRKFFISEHTFPFYQIHFFCHQHHHRQPHASHSHAMDDDDNCITDPYT